MLKIHCDLMFHRISRWGKEIHTFFAKSKAKFRIIFKTKNFPDGEIKSDAYDIRRNFLRTQPNLKGKKNN